MRYALRNQDKIAEAYSPDYVKCLIESLDHFFKTVDEDAIADYWRINTMHSPYPVLQVNDVADTGAIFEFAIIGRTFDVLRLAFIGRRK